MSYRLYRMKTDRMLAGVASGVADSLAIDPSIVRIFWIILTLMTGGLMLLLYVAMAIIVPEAPAGYRPSYAGPDAPVDARDSGAPGAEASAADTGAATTTDWRRERGMQREGREGAAPVVIGLGLVLIGGYFLLRQFLPALDLDRLWPIAVIGLGILLIAGSLRRSRA
jgi:phage shock protein C